MIFKKLFIIYIPFILIFLTLFSFSISSSIAVLKIGTNYFNISLDPYKYNRTNNLSINQHIFESLVTIDNNGKIIPLLASNWINVDDRTWIFNLKKNIFFSNQQPLTADDVIYSFERVNLFNNRDIASDFGINLSIIIMEKINDYSIKIVTEDIFPAFLLKLRNCSILPKNYIEKNGLSYFLDHPVGTGPYMNPEIIENTKIAGLENIKVISLTRNEKYWGKKPYFKKVYFYLSSEDKILELLKKEELDIAVWMNFNFFYELPILKNYKKISIPGLRTNFLVLNCLDKNLSNVLVRKAIYYSLDLNEITKKIFFDNSTTANQLVSPYVIGFNPKIPLQNKNIELAKKLLSDAKLSEGFPLKLHFSNQDSIFSKIALLIKNYLSKVNIDLSLISVSDSELSKIRKERNFQIIPYSLSSGTGDALFILSTLIHSKSGTMGQYNFSGFSDDEIDNLIKKASEEFNEKKRIELYQKIMELTMNKLPYIPLYWPNFNAVIKSN
ncbi:MAG: ABC transporter substrate-binding protein, partial [Exilispira sp.]